MRTLYEPRAEFNQNGEETLCIHGIYDATVGAASPVLARLTQWKIVPKRAVDLAIDLKGATAPSRSSVNNCTGSESDQPALELSKSLNRYARRQLTNRLRGKETTVHRHFTLGTAEQNVAIARTIDEIHLLTGITLNRGEALHLIAHGKSRIGGKWYRGSVNGDIFPASPSHHERSKKILGRVKSLTRNSLSVQ